MDLEKLEQDIWENILGGCQLDSDEREDNYRGIIGCSIVTLNNTIEILEKCLHPNNEDGAYTNIIGELKILNANLLKLKSADKKLCSCGAEIPDNDPFDGYCNDCG